MHERTHEETYCEGCEIGDVGEGVVAGRIKLYRKNCGERPENIEVVPLDQGSGRGAKDHTSDTVGARRADARLTISCHSVLDLG